MIRITNLKELNEVKESDYSNIKCVTIYSIVNWCDTLNKIFNFVNLITLKLYFESKPRNIPINKLALLQQLIDLSLIYQKSNCLYGCINEKPLIYDNNMLICYNVPALESVEPNIENINILLYCNLTESFFNNLPPQIKKMRFCFDDTNGNLKLDNLPIHLEKLEIVFYKKDVFPLEIKLPFGCKLILTDIFELRNFLY